LASYWLIVAGASTQKSGASRESLSSVVVFV